MITLALAHSSSSQAQPEPANPPTSFRLIEEFSGSDFFSHFNFETFSDPTQGFVDYVRQSRANYLHLLHIDPSTGRVRIESEHKEKVYGRGRPAIRLTSKTVFNSGLFIIDVNHIPEGNAVWPAFWSFGPDWPNSGEIDIIEGINNQNFNQATLHSSPGCVMPKPDPTKMTGQFIDSLNCNYVDGHKGCTTAHEINSFGPGFNKNGGGVLAFWWTNDFLSVWYWPRSRVPANIVSGSAPDPSQWGTPASYFQFGNNCSPRKFRNHNLVLNTTFCGEWAGETYVGADGRRGKDACNYYVANNPKAFENAYWEINFIKAFKAGGN